VHWITAVLTMALGQMFPVTVLDRFDETIGT
jgi:hypothetical protein